MLIIFHQTFINVVSGHYDNSLSLLFFSNNYLYTVRVHIHINSLCKDKIEMEIFLHRRKASGNSIGGTEKTVAGKTNKL